MKKTILIDTNLLLDDANVIYKLSKEYEKILIPLTVLKELDNKKYNPDLSYSARNAIKSILQFKEEHPDKIIFHVGDTEISGPDARIIDSAINNKAEIATKDVSMSIIAGAKNIKTKLYDAVPNGIFNPYIYINHQDLYKDEDVFSYDQKYTEDEYKKVFNLFIEASQQELIRDAWFFVFINTEMENPVTYAHNPINHEFDRIDNRSKYRKFNIDQHTSVKAMDQYQNCAIYAMIKAPNTLICGQYGSGKSLLSTAYALTNHDRKTFLSRPNLTVDRRFELGFLPGPQPLDSKILTPTGWTTMGEIKKGDYVIGDDGKKTKVLEIFNKGIKDVYTIETTNGGSTKACGNHLWATKIHNELKHNKNFKLRSTLEIKETLYNPNKGTKLNHTLPMNGVVNYKTTQELPIPPYTLGVLLGDGSFSNSISFASIDGEIVDRVKNEIKEYHLELTTHGISHNIHGEYINSKPARPVKIIDIESKEEIIYRSVGEAAKNENINKSTVGSRCTKNLIVDGKLYCFLDAKRWRNYIKNCVYELGLEGKKAINKFIPDIYKYASIENRTATLQGLMDTDGTIKESTGEQCFTTISKQLAEDVIEVSRSLGMNATYYNRNRIGKRTRRPNGGDIIKRHISYEVTLPKSDTIDVFYLKRKLDRTRKPIKNKHVKIKNIKYSGKELVKCIKIDNGSSLYITDDFIVTHNTIEDKLSPWMTGIISGLYHIFSNTKGQTSDKMVGEYTYDFVKENIFRKYFEMIPLETMQGISFLDGDLLLLDETQLCSISILSIVLSRFGKGSKLIATGDVRQSYGTISTSESGLIKLLRLLPSKYMAYVELKYNYRSGLLELADGLQNKTLG